MKGAKSLIPHGLLLGLGIFVLVGVGCSPADYRKDANRVVTNIIHQKQLEAKGRTEPFTIDTPAETLRQRLLLGQKLPYAGKASLSANKLSPVKAWPEDEYPTQGLDSDPTIPLWKAEGPLKLTLVDALRVAAANNREYQTKKEDIFRSALDLDLERNAYRNTLQGMFDFTYTSDLSGGQTKNGIEQNIAASLTRPLKTGASFVSRIFIDLVKLLTLDRSSAFGIFADATISIPLLLGSGRHIVTEPLTQAEREVVYTIYAFERFKRTLVVQVAGGYLDVLSQLDQLKNAEENYQRLKLSADRARRLADAGRLPEIQVDQAQQNRLRSRDRWIATQQIYAGLLDSFKIRLGLPTDARIELHRSELDGLQITDARPSAQADRTGDKSGKLAPPTREGGGPMELEDSVAVELAIKHRLDFRVLQDRVDDAQRAVVVAADALRAGLTLTGTAQVGGRRGITTAGLSNAYLRPGRGRYSAEILLDLPWERTAERNAYRDSYIVLERAVRAVQGLEDQIKLEVRDALRSLLKARASYKIQTQAVELARRRIKSTEMFLQAGRAQIRDVLEAQEDLISAQNAFTAALVNYRVTELELQRDMGVLQVDHKGLWSEYKHGQAD